MKKPIITLAIAVLALSLSACTAMQQGLRNATAADCSTEATQQAFVNNLPPNLFVTGAQEIAIEAQLCYADFGSVPAPVTAPGNAPMIPAVPAIPVAVAPVPAPVAPVPTAAPTSAATLPTLTVPPTSTH